MAIISKRVRYEVLRRDDFRCRYCGRRAPDVELHVDHLIPKAWGGTDAKWNLATACQDCNIAKSDTPAPQWLLMEVRDDEAVNLHGQVAKCQWCHAPFLVAEGLVEEADMCDACMSLSIHEFIRGLDYGKTHATEGARC